MKKKKLEDYRETFSLNQQEVHLFGQLLLNQIHNSYEQLINDADNCWCLDANIELLKKLTTIVVRLQCGRKLKEDKDEQKRN